SNANSSEASRQLSLAIETLLAPTEVPREVRIVRDEPPELVDPPEDPLLRRAERDLQERRYLGECIAFDLIEQEGQPLVVGELFQVLLQRAQRRPALDAPARVARRLLGGL